MIKYSYIKLTGCLVAAALAPLCTSAQRIGMISGWLCDSLGGYHYFFMWALLATVPAFLLAARIPFTYPDTEEVTAEEVDKELINE